MSAQSTNAANNASGQSAIITAQGTHDTEMKAALMTLKNDLEAKLEDIKTLLQTPQGSREGFGSNK